MKTKWLLFFWLALVGSVASAGTPGEVPVGSLLRDAPLYGFFGDFRKLSDLRGKPLIINVWASWCGPCRAEMASLERLSRRYGKKFNVIGISTDDYAEPPSTYLLKAKITFDNYQDQKLLWENMLGANAIPLTVLVDEQGRVLQKVRGAREWDSPEALEIIGKAFRIKM